MRREDGINPTHSVSDELSKSVPAHWAAIILSDLTTPKTTLDTMADLDYRPTVEEYGSEYLPLLRRPAPECGPLGA